MAVESVKQAADIAEVVKLEVAKIETLIAKLNKDRAENPPFVSITYCEESGDPRQAEIGTAVPYTEEGGEPEKAEVSAEEKKFADDFVKHVNERRDEILKAIEDMKTFNYGYITPQSVSLRPELWTGIATTLPNGQPFEFKPTQVHPVITEGGE
jgi:hypothetical protein